MGNQLRMSSSKENVDNLEQDRDLSSGQVSIYDYGGNNPSGGYCVYLSGERHVDYWQYKNSYCRTDKMQKGSSGNEYDHYDNVSFADCQTKCTHNRACTGFEHFHTGYAGQCEIWYYPSIWKKTEGSHNYTIHARCYWKKPSYSD